jgi:hypothetical protein
MYETKIKDFTLNLEDGRSFWFPETLSNGRVSYVAFECLVRALTELYKAKNSDHTDGELLYEQKGYVDPSLDPRGKDDLFNCAPSSCFGPNNYGPVIKALLEDGDYDGAYQVCATRGYSENDFYVFTNTGHFDVANKFSFFIIPTATLLEHLDSSDPRMVSRTTMLSLVTRTETI